MERDRTAQFHNCAFRAPALEKYLHLFEEEEPVEWRRKQQQQQQGAHEERSVMVVGDGRGGAVQIRLKPSGFHVPGNKYASYAPADCMSRKGGSPVTRKQGREQEVALGELNPEAQMRKLQAVILEEEEEEEEEKKKEKEEEEEEEEPHHQGEVGAVCTTSCCDPTPNNWSTPSSPQEKKCRGYPSAIESRAQNRVTVEPLFGAFIQNLRRRKQRWRPGGEIS